MILSFLFDLRNPYLGVSIIICFQTFWTFCAKHSARSARTVWFYLIILKKILISLLQHTTVCACTQTGEQIKNFFAPWQVMCLVGLGD